MATACWRKVRPVKPQLVCCAMFEHRNIHAFLKAFHAINPIVSIGPHSNRPQLIHILLRCKRVSFTDSTNSIFNLRYSLSCGVLQSINFPTILWVFVFLCVLASRPVLLSGLGRGPRGDGRIGAARRAQGQPDGAPPAVAPPPSSRAFGG